MRHAKSVAPGGKWEDNTSSLLEAIDQLFGERLRAGDGDLGTRLWCALVNTDWVNGETRILLTFRMAGLLLANVIDSDDYMDGWYLASGEYAKPDEEIDGALAELGWTPENRGEP